MQTLNLEHDFLYYTRTPVGFTPICPMPSSQVILGRLKSPAKIILLMLVIIPSTVLKSFIGLALLSGGL